MSFKARAIIRFFLSDFGRVSAGLPPFIIQEEFDRYIGFLWQNAECMLLWCCVQAGLHVLCIVGGDGVFRILYEEVRGCWVAHELQY